MSDPLQGLVDSIVAETAGLPEPDTLATWKPELSGDIDILIRADGTWEHDREPILREGLVRLFASLLRRESDGHYYLVTPIEKWRIRVEKHALQVVDCDQRGRNGDGAWYAKLNTGGQCRLGAERILHPENNGEAPWLSLPNGLSAQVTRAAWYRLIDAATVEDDQAYVFSAGERIVLGSID